MSCFDPRPPFPYHAYDPGVSAEERNRIVANYWRIEGEWQRYVNRAAIVHLSAIGLALIVLLGFVVWRLFGAQ